MLYNLPNEALSNVNLNSLGSDYAQQFGHDLSLLVAKQTREQIFDSSPKQFYDLALMNAKAPKSWNSDEFFYKEVGYQRQPLIATGTAAAVAWPSTQTFTISTLDDVSTDTMIAYPNGQMGNVTAINSSTSQITVTPMTNSTLPAVVIGDSFANISSVEADGVDGFAQYFRQNSIERNGYIQLFSKAIHYGQVELYKLQKGAIHKDWLASESRNMMRQHKIDLSNAFWMGRKGEITTAAGDKAKLTDGVFTMMQNAGSPNATTTTATLADAFEDMVLASEYGDFGDVRFAYMTPRVKNELRKAYTTQLTRYTPENQNIAKLYLDEIRLGSSRIVLVPFQRFESPADFYPGFDSRIVILDHMTIDTYEMWGATSGTTPDRSQGFAKSYKDMWVACQMGVAMNNPLASAWVDITGL
jgi:hypothetical protein